MGENLQKVDPPHGDNHQLWIDPNDTKRMVQANDGGGTVTFDGGNRGPAFIISRRPRCTT
ncbi:hypothetical protein [Spirosoma telluris]|uniref:hypothetical protein n=1 Tax=Spirosoma telluris TaxID=2183553 RepID=UPI002FC3CB63